MADRPANAGPGTAPPVARPVTISGVARLAGVSRATVSRVMNGRTSVDPDLARRVVEAATRLGYRPSAVAQSLARGRTGLVAIVVPDLANPMFQAVLRGLSDAAGAEDHRLLVADTHEVRAEEAILAGEARRRCDGIVLCAPRMPDEQLRRLATSLAPVVLVNRVVAELDVSTVSVDHGAGVRALAGHLAALGHRRVAYLAGPSTSMANVERVSALRACARARFSLVELACGAMFGDGYRTADEALAAGATAVIGYNDLVAVGAIGRLHDLGVDIPGRMSVAGFDDIPFARYTAPPLTTVSVPQENLGREAWQRLSATLHGQRPEPDVRYTPRLEVRRSTGPPR